jgi:hypothetical protein
MEEANRGEAGWYCRSSGRYCQQACVSDEVGDAVPAIRLDSWFLTIRFPARERLLDGWGEMGM